MDLLRMLKDSNDAQMVDNFRPLQDLNDRQVYSSFEIPGQRMKPEDPTADATAVRMTVPPFLLTLVAALFKY